MHNGLALVIASLLSSIAMAAGPQLISADDYGADWPFSVAELHLSCLPGRALVVTDVESGVMYPLNGTARGKARALALAPVEPIWRDNPAVPGTKLSLSALIEQGLQLCK